MLRYRKIGRAGTWVAPAITTPPVIAGTAQQGRTLSVTADGVWANGVASIARQWYSNTANSTVGGTAITGETAATYLEGAGVVGDYVYCGEIATNPGGSSPVSYSNIIGPVASLTLGTLTVVRDASSPAGSVPMALDLSSSNTLPPGFFLQWEMAASLTPPTNADGSFTTPTQKDVKFINGNDWALNATSLGFVQPSIGPLDFHCRALISDPAGLIGPLTSSDGETDTYTALTTWGNYTDTIAGSVAKLTAVAGLSMSKLLTVTNGNLTGTVNSGGAFIASRSDHAAANDEWYTEATITAFGASGVLYLGVTDQGIDFNGGTQGFFGGGTKLPGDANMALSLTSITNVGTTATATTSGAHGLRAGGSVVVSGTTPAAYSGTFTVASVPSQTTFTYTMLSNPGGSATVVGSYIYVPAGFTFTMGSGASNIGCHLNGTTTTFPLGGPTLAVGDIIGLHRKASTQLVECYYKSIGGGAGGKIGATQTLTSGLPSGSDWLFAGGNKTNDSITVNIAGPMAMTAPAGIYG